MSSGRLPEVDAVKAQDNFRVAIEAGLLKIMSKMGKKLLNTIDTTAAADMLLPLLCTACVRDVLDILSWVAVNSSSSCAINSN
jgi:glutamate synthase domain-containing protein 2